jgi:hypothetical protein
MRRNSILKLTTLFLTLAVGAWACCTEVPVANGLLQFGPGVGTGLVCPGTSTDAALGCGLAPNPTPLKQLDVFFNLANPTGSASDLDMFRLIIGVPVASQTRPGVPMIDAVNTYNPGFSTVLDGTDRGGTFCGFFGSGGANAYSACGGSGGAYTPTLPSGGNTFAAWSAAELEIGLNPTYFALYYYNLDNVGGGTAGDLDPGGRYDVFFKTPLALGTMEIAYGCSTLTAGCPCYFTPFTQSGQSTPEPASWLLVSGAAIGILLSRFRITRKKKS